jgi:hypothetical protein
MCFGGPLTALRALVAVLAVDPSSARRGRNRHHRVAYTCCADRRRRGLDDADDWDSARRLPPRPDCGMKKSVPRCPARVDPAFHTLVEVEAHPPRGRTPSVNRMTAICAERSLRIVMFDAEVGEKAATPRSRSCFRGEGSARRRPSLAT